MSFRQKFSDYIFRFLERLTFSLPTAALEIGDSSLRFLRLERKNLISASLRLPPNVISGGRIQNRDQLLSFLKDIHRQLTRKERNTLPVVVSLPAASVYTQSFSIPEVSEADFAETAALNLQMLSPVERLESTYYGWQKIGRREGENQLDILGAFVNRILVDDLDVLLRESGFYAVAFEFPALALARLFRNLTRQTSGLYLAINVSTDGIDFMIIRNGELYFSYFHSWRSIQGESRQIKLNDFQETIYQEIQKVINFSAGHWSVPITTVLLVAQGFEKEISQVIQTKFNFKIVPIRIPEHPGLNPAWFSVFGSALRAMIPRSSDTSINLAGIGAKEELHRSQIVTFISLWRNIFAAALVILIFEFALADFILLKFNEDLGRQISGLVTQPETQEVARLEEEAKKFNRSVQLVKNAQSAVEVWSPFFKKINELAGSQITINKLLVPSASSPFTLSGWAPNERAAVDFKNRLAEQPQFTGVNLPLTSIVTKGNLVNFNLTFSLENLNF